MNPEIWLRSLTAIARFNDVPADNLKLLQTVLTQVLSGNLDNAMISSQLSQLKSLRSISSKKAYSRILSSAMGTDTVPVKDGEAQVANYRVRDEKGCRIAVFHEDFPDLFLRVTGSTQELKKFIRHPKISANSLVRFKDGEDLWDILTYNSLDSDILRYMAVFCKNGTAAPADYGVPIIIADLHSDAEVSRADCTNYF